MARKYKPETLGASVEEQARVHQLVAQVRDVHSGFTGLCYSAAFAEHRSSYAGFATPKLKQFEDFLGDRQWLVGSGVTVADIWLAEELDIHQLLEPTILDSLPRLKGTLKYTFCVRYSNTTS